MKKVCLTLIFCAYCLLHQSVVPAFSGSDEIEDRSAPRLRIAAVQDGLSDFFYPYVDESGNKHVTNSPAAVLGEFRVAASGQGALSKKDTLDSEGPSDEESKDYEGEEETIPDPLEPVNRVFFQFNDKLYFWFLKPVATGYKTVVPQRARVSVSNFFYNVAFPIRFVNSLFQAKLDVAGIEMTRFLFNSIIGIGGLFDPAEAALNMKKPDEEDLGQTLGFYGLGPAFYINWPFFGPSSLRDSIGFGGDTFLSPTHYFISPIEYLIAVKGYERVNKSSLTLGEYEDLKAAALDPYVAVRDAYSQYRRNKIKK